LNLH